MLSAGNSDSRGGRRGNPVSRDNSCILRRLPALWAVRLRSFGVDYLSELAWRGHLCDATDGAAEHLTQPRIGYIGFDPTAESLTIGNFATIILLVRFQRAGHRPIALAGGGTGLIGDPSGRDSERSLLDRDAIVHRVERIRAQLTAYLDFEGPHAAQLVDNYEWLAEEPLLTFLRDTGKHFPVNYMLAKESVKSRLAKGLSFTEFSYMLLQARDFLELKRRYGCTLQIGGSDQWGNITAGTELIRRSGAGEAFGVTGHLILRADGKKFGKSEDGALWIDPEMTSPYELHQYFLNTPDADAIRYLKIFTMLGREEIDALAEEQGLKQTVPSRRAVTCFFCSEFVLCLSISNENLESRINKIKNNCDEIIVVNEKNIISKMKEFIHEYEVP